MTTITGRVSSVPSASSTPRVATIGAQEAISGGVGEDCWGGTWGGAWGLTWRSFNADTPAVPASPAIDATPRVSSSPAANNTKRVTLA